MMKIVAITSCSTGIAHTYMAAEALEVAAKELGYQIRVETQGSIGAENVLTAQEIKDADAVVIAASTTVNKDRFTGKKLREVDVNDAIQRGKALLESASSAEVYNAKGQAFAEKRAAMKTMGIYAHLMTGVSYMIPFVVAGGICIALAFAFGGIHSEGATAGLISKLGGLSMGLMWPVLGGYVAFSIADRPGLIPGMVLGMMASQMSAGFLGALVGGFLAGYIVRGIKKIVLPKALMGLMPILIIPVVSVLVGGVIFNYFIGTPVTWLNKTMTDWLVSMSSGSSGIVLGAILGAMMAIDLAGPIGKAAYFFGVASLTNLAQGETSPIMAAVMISGMVPPLAMALSSTIIGKNRYTNELRESGKSAWVLGLSFISEGAIPFAVADPIRVLCSCTVGAAASGALSMIFHCGIAVPHGGFFVFMIPGAVSHVFLYVLALLIGTAVSGVLITALKKPIEETAK